MATAVQMDGSSMKRVQPAAEVRVTGCTSHEQAFAIQNLLVEAFPTGLKLAFKIQPSAKKLEVTVNEKVLISKEVSKLLEDDIAGLWPTDRAKVKAEIRGWLDDSPEEQQHAPTEIDPSVRERTGSSTCEVIGSVMVILSVGVAIYVITYFLSLGLSSSGRGDDTGFESQEL